MMRITKKRLNRITDENTGRISHCAWEYLRRAGTEKADLRQEGYLALLKLVKKASRQDLNRTVSNFLHRMIRAAAETRNMAGLPAESNIHTEIARIFGIRTKPCQKK